MKQSASFSVGVWQIYCNKCKHSTNHNCKLDEFSVTKLDEDQDIDEYGVEVDGLRLWSCAGCDEWTIEEYWALIPVGEYDMLIDRKHVVSRYLPERIVFFAELKKYHQLPPTLDLIYREVVHSYNSDLGILCAVGIRMLLEGICADKEIRGGNLSQKIEGLSSKLPENIIDNLHSLRFLGNEAAHELIKPDQDELHLAVNLAEDLLNYLYELDYRASGLTERRKRLGKKNYLDKRVPAEPDEGTENSPSDSENE